jgi:hypothetical protein
MRGVFGGRGSLFAFGVVALPAACTSGDGGDRFTRHFDAGPWASAVEQNVSAPREWVPEATLLLATLFVLAVLWRTLRSGASPRA